MRSVFEPAAAFPPFFAFGVPVTAGAGASLVVSVISDWLGSQEFGRHLVIYLEVCTARLLTDRNGIPLPPAAPRSPSRRYFVFGVLVPPIVSGQDLFACSPLAQRPRL